MLYSRSAPRRGYSPSSCTNDVVNNVLIRCKQVWNVFHLYAVLISPSPTSKGSSITHLGHNYE
jgi:hypothetical protein